MGIGTPWGPTSFALENFEASNALKVFHYPSGYMASPGSDFAFVPLKLCNVEQTLIWKPSRVVVTTKTRRAVLPANSLSVCGA
jgi:hypothetical protein